MSPGPDGVPGWHLYFEDEYILRGHPDDFARFVPEATVHDSLPAHLLPQDGSARRRACFFVRCESRPFGREPHADLRGLCRSRPPRERGLHCV